MPDHAPEANRTEQYRCRRPPSPSHLVASASPRPWPSWLLASLLTGLATAAPASAAPSVTSAERAFVSSINGYRRASHRTQLRTSPTLTLVARRWAQSMARSNRLAHNPRVTRQVHSWRYLGENVGVGGSTSSLHRAFMRSAPHRANLLSTRYTHVGVGVAYAHGRMWVVEVFAGRQRPSSGRRTGRPPSATAPAAPR